MCCGFQQAPQPWDLIQLNFKSRAKKATGIGLKCTIKRVRNRNEKRRKFHDNKSRLLPVPIAGFWYNQDRKYTMANFPIYRYIHILYNRAKVELSD
jgi:hypothetical protein